MNKRRLFTELQQSADEKEALTQTIMRQHEVNHVVKIAEFHNCEAEKLKYQIRFSKTLEHECEIRNREIVSRGWRATKHFKEIQEEIREKQRPAIERNKEIQK
jgi:hypothetical protein